MKQEKKYKSVEIVAAIKDLEYLRHNIARLGRFDENNDEEFLKFILLTNLFITEVDIYKKLTKVWRILMNGFADEEEEELDDLVSENGSWVIPYDLSNDQIMKRIREALNGESSE